MDNAAETYQGQWYSDSRRWSIYHRTFPNQHCLELDIAVISTLLIQ
jgi:hypothetical protein